MLEPMWTRFAPAVVLPCLLGQAGRHPHDFAAAFDEIHRLVAGNFLDPGLRGLDWRAIGREFGAQAAAARDLEEFGAVINEMLARLETSHTRFYTGREPAYYQLLAIFRPLLDERIRQVHPDNAALEYPGIGLFTERIDGEDFVSGVLEGWPAAQAGLRPGDRIVSVEGAPFHPLGSFEGRVGRETRMQIQRTADAASCTTVVLVPVSIDPAELFVRAMQESVRVFERGERHIGYVHLWSFAGERYGELLRSEIGSGRLHAADALVLDLRGGWGGANPDDLNLFDPRVPILEHVLRDGTRCELDTQWRKPVALLIDAGSRSGKEVFAYGFRKHGIGPVIGATSAGAVAGGQPFLIGPGMLLYLAVLDVLVDGERLEGRGVQPDVPVTFDLRYAAGADPQLEAALKELLGALGRPR
jgi:carboxyl-terminal processing protease